MILARTGKTVEYSNRPQEGSRPFPMMMCNDMVKFVVCALPFRA
jgi:hypothetical protein